MMYTYRVFQEWSKDLENRLLEVIKRCGITPDGSAQEITKSNEYKRHKCLKSPFILLNS